MSEHFDSAEDREDEPTDGQDEDDTTEDGGGNPWAKTSSGDADEI